MSDISTDTNIEVLENQKQELVDKITVLRQEHDGVLNTISLDKGRIKTFQEQADRLQQQAREQLRKNEALKNDTEILNGLRDKSAADADEKKEELRLLCVDIKNKEETLQEINDSVSTEKSQMESKILTIRKNAEDTEQGILDSIATLNTRESELKNDLDKRKAELKKSIELLEEKKTELDQLDSSITEKNKQIILIEEKIAEVENNLVLAINKQNTEIEKSLTSKDIAEASLASSKKELNDIKYEIGVVTLELSVLKEEESNYKAKLMNLRKLRQQINEKEDYLREKYEEIGLEYR